MIRADLMKKAALFAGGVLFGTAGVKILSSKDAKNAYVQAAAAVLRVKDCVMDTVTTVQENAEDVLAEAKEVNEKRQEEEIYVEQEHIRFPGCHLFLLGRKADTAFDLMLDFYSHFSSSCSSVSSS